MRLIGNLETSLQTGQYIAFLRTKGVSCSFGLVEDDKTDGPWNIWIHDEQQVSLARDWFAEFQRNPKDAQFDVDPVKVPAVSSRSSSDARQTGSSSGSRHRKGYRYEAAVPLGRHFDSKLRQKHFPVTIAIIVISIAASLMTHFGKPKHSGVYGERSFSEKVFEAMSFVTVEDYFFSHDDSFALIRQGQVWRLFTPMFLHVDEKHLGFNMLWLFFLGSAIERVNGSFFFLAIVLVTELGASLLQVLIPDAHWIPETLRGSPFAIGASGVVYGLFGFLWIRPVVDRDYPVYLVPLYIVLMMAWLFACMTPMVPNVANGAHVGGLLSGMLIGAIRPLGKYHDRRQNNQQII